MPLTNGDNCDMMKVSEKTLDEQRGNRKGGGPVNKQLLLQKMEEKGISITDMYTRLNMSRSAFYRKCNGYSEFTLEEMKHIMSILGEDDPREIFFAEKVS